LRSFARTIATFVNRVGFLTLTVDSYPTSESPFDSSGHVITQFLRSLQRSLDPDNFHLAGRDLSGRFAVISRSHQAALVAGQHAPEDRNRTFKRTIISSSVGMSKSESELTIFSLSRTDLDGLNSFNPLP
jgi:hypothetical protein